MRTRAPLLLLVFLLCLTFFTGGSTWASEPHLMILRPAALVVSALAILTLRKEHLTGYGLLFGLFIGAVLVTSLHLLPLPFEWWSNLPGRDTIVAIDQTVGLGQIKRPLSMSPDATLNALYSLSVPLAVLLLAVQIDEAGHRLVLVALLVLAMLSGMIGLLQATGMLLEFYPKSTPTPGLFANRNHQGALQALILPMAAGVAALDYGKKINPLMKYVFACIVAALAIPLIIVTGSRSALLVVAVGLILAVSICDWTRPGVTSTWKGRLLAPLAFAAVTLGLVWATVFSSRDLAFERLREGGQDLRLPVWQSIVEMLPTYMPWGTGVGSYAEAYQILEPDALLRPTRSNHAHNEFLEIALTAGVPGMFLLGCAALALALAAWRAFSAETGKVAGVTISRVGCSLIILLAIASATDYPTRTPILAAVLLLAASWASLKSNASTRTQPNEGQR